MFDMRSPARVIAWAILRRARVLFALGCVFASAHAFAQFAYQPLNLTQSNTDATALCAGCSSKNTSVRVTATSSDSSCGAQSITYWMEYEVRPIGTAFTGTATQSSTTYTKKNCVTAATPIITVSGLAPGYYHWRVQERSSYPDYSGWVDFNNGGTAFAIAGPTTKLVFSNGPQTVVANQCVPLTIQAQDASSIPASQAAALTVNLSTSSGTFYSNATCTTTTTTASIAVGANNATFYWKPAAAGSQTVTGSSGTLTPANQTETVNLSALVFTTAAQDIRDNTCSAITTVQSQNGSGGALTVASATTVNLSSTSGTVVFYSDSACTTPVTSITIPAAGSTASFYFKDSSYGPQTFSATSAQRTTGTQVETISGPAPAETPYQAVTFGEIRETNTYYDTEGYKFTLAYPGTLYRLCGYFTGSLPVRVYNASGTVLATATVTGTGSAWKCTSINPVALSAGTYSVAVQNTGGGTLYDDNGCYSLCNQQTPLTSGTVTIQGGCYGNTAGADPCSYVDTYEVYGLVDIGFTASSPTSLSFTTPPAATGVGQCSSPLTVSANSPSAYSAQTVTLSSSLTGVTFYADTDTNCATAITTRSIPTGGQSVSFRIKGTTLGSGTLTASAPGLTPATQTATITATGLRFTTPTATLTQGTCSGVVTVQNQASGVGQNVASATPIVLSSDSSLASFYSDATCTTRVSSVTMAAGTSTVSFYFRDDNVGTPTLSVNATGIATGTQQYTINSCNTSRLALQAVDAVIDSYNLETYSEGYSFTPLKPGQVTQLCGNFQGTAKVSLFRRSDGVRLSSVNITSNKTWVCTNITPVSVDANVGYSVAVWVNNISAGWRTTTATLPFTSGDIRIEGSCDISGSDVEPCSGGAGFSGTLYGMPDIRYVSESVSSLKVTSFAQSISAGTCSAVTTVGAAGCNNAVQRVAANTTVNLSSSSPTLTFYADTDTTCSSPLTAVTLAANSTTAGFRFKDSSAGTPLVTGAASGLSSGSQTETITSTGPSRLAFSNAAQTVTAGTCSGALTVQSRDSANNPANVASLTTVTLSSTSGGAQFFTDAACGTAAITTVNIAAGTSSAPTVYFKDTVAGTPTLTAAASGLTPGTQGETVNAAAPNALAFTSAGQTLTAGNCSGATVVQSKDPFNNASNVTAATTVNLSSTSTGATFYSNSTCTTSITSTTLASGTNAATVYWKDTVAGSPNLTASATGLGSGVQGELVNAAAPNKFAITTPPRTVTAGACSPIVTVQSRDAFNNPANVGAATPVTLSTTTTGGAGTFYSDVSCTVQVAAVTIASGANSASYYFKDTVAGTPTHTASGSLTATTQLQTVTAGSPTRFAFASAPVSITAGGCSTALTLQSQDNFGNAAAVTGATVANLGTTSGAGAFSTSSSCGTTTTSATIAAGSSSVLVYYKDTLAGSPQVTASQTGFTPGNQTETVNAGAPSKVVFTSSAQTVTAGNCSLAANVQLKDAFNNVSPATSATSLTLSSTSGTGTFFSDAACGTGVGGITVPSGSSAGTFYFRDTTAGPATLTVSGTGLTPGTQTATFTAGTATRLAFSNSSFSAAAGACTAVTVQSRDGSNNPSNVGAATVVTVSANDGAGLFFSDSGCTAGVGTVTIASGTSSIGAYFKDTLAGSPLLTAQATGFSNGTQTETITAASPFKLAFTTSPQTVAAGNCSGITTVQSRDNFNNASNVSSATAVNLTANSGTLRFYSDAACTAQVTSSTIPLGGNVTSFFFKDSVQGGPLLTAQATGLSNGTQTETISAGSGTKLAFLTSSQTLTAGNCSAVMTVQSQDSLGNPVNVASALAVTLTDTSAGGQIYSDSGCTTAVGSVTIAAATSTTSFYYKDTLAGSSTVTASASGYTNAAQTETVNPASATKLAFTSSAQTLTAGNCSGATTVQTRDNFDNTSNASAAVTVNLANNSTNATFYSDSSCTTAITTVGIASGANLATFYFKDRVAGAHTLTVTATSYTLATQPLTVNAAAASTLAFSTSAVSVTAGNCSPVLTAKTNDNFGNASNVGSNTAVSLTSSSGTTTFYSDASCTTAVASVTISTGQNAASFYFKDTTSGSPTFTLTASGLTSTTQVETVNAASATRVAFTTGPKTQTAGSCSLVTSVQSRDTFGNASNVTSAAALNLSSTSGGNTFYSDSGCTAAITSVTIASGSNSASFYFKDNNAGSPTLTVTNATLGSTTQVETINPAAAARVAFSSSSVTVTAGNCSPAVTVQSRDNFGNAVNLGSATAVNLSSSSGGASFYSDSTCTTAVAAVTIGAGSSSASFYFKDTVSGAPTLTATATGLTPGTQGETINAASPTQLAFTTAPKSLTAGACATAVTVEARDVFGNRSNVSSATVLALSSTSTGNTFFSDAACGSAVTQATIASGASSVSFYFKDTVAGSPTVTVSGLGSTTQVETINAGSATALGFANAPVTATAGSCSPALTVRSQDGSGNASPVGAATTVNVGSSSGGNTFYADSACTSAVTSVVIAAGQSGQPLYFKDNAAGSPTITLTATGFTTGTQVETVSAGAATRLAFTTSSQTLAAGACSGATTVQRQDAFSNGSTLGGAVTVTPSSSSTGATFYSNSTCTTVVSTVTISSGTSSATFFWKDTKTGAPTLTAAASGLTPTTQTETVNAASASVLAMTSAVQNLTAGACSAAASFQVRDTFGNASPVASATTVNLSSTSGQMTFFTNSTCTTQVSSISLSAGSSSGTFYFKDTLAGSPTLTVASSGLTPATQAETITAASPTVLAFSTTAQTVTAGNCSALTRAETRDSFGNPSNVTAALAVNLQSSAPSGTFYSDATCTTQVAGVTVAAGTRNATFYFKQTQAGSPTLTLSASGYSNGAQVENILAAAAAKLVLVSAPQTVTAGSCSLATTVQSQDGFNNASAVAANTSISLASSSTGATFYSDASCTTAVSAVTLSSGASSVDFYWKDNNAGAPTLTVSGGSLTPGTQGETVNPGAANKLFFSTGALTVTAGVCSPVQTVQSRDALNNPAPVAAATTVTVTTNSGAGAFYSDSSCTTTIGSVTIASGASSASMYFKENNAGSPLHTATASGLTAGTVTHTISPAPASRLVFTTSALNVTAGACSPAFTVQSQNNSGVATNVASATPINLSSSSGSTVFYSNSTCTTVATSVTMAAGTANVTAYFKDTTAGTPTVTASATGFTSGTQVETVNAAATSVVVFISPSRSISAGGCSAIVNVQTQDAFSNPATQGAARAVTLTTSSTGGTFYSDATCTTAIAGVTIAAGANSAGFYFKDTTAGSPTLTAASSGIGSGTQVESVSPAAPSKLVFSTSAQTLTAGNCSGAVTVQAQDSFGNVSPVSAATAVSLSSSSTGNTFYSNSSCGTTTAGVTIPSASSTATFYFKDTKTGSPTLTASATGYTPGTQVQTITSASATALAFTTSSQTLTAGSCSGAITVQSRDNFGNASNVGAATPVTLSTTSTGGTFYSNSTCTTLVSGVTLASGTSAQTFYYKDTRAGSLTVTASATGFTPANQSHTITPAAASKLVFTSSAQTLTAGGCSAAFTVQSQDTFGNVSSVAAATTVNLSSSSAQGTFYSGAACGGGAVTSIAMPSGSSSATFYYGDTLAGSPTLTASAASLAAGTQVQTVTPAAATKLVFTSSAQTVTAGSCSLAATVQVRDAFDNAAPVGSARTVTPSSNSPTTTFFSDAACGTSAATATVASGASTTSFYFRGTVAGSFTLTAASSGLTSATQPFTLSSASATKLAFTSASQTLTAGNCSGAVTLQAQDGFNNAANVGSATTVTLSSSSTGATFFSDATCSTASSSPVIAAGSSGVTLYFRDTKSGSPTVTATASGLTPANQSHTINSAAVAQLVFTSAPQTLVAGNCSGAASLQTRDAFGNGSNVAAPTSVTLSSTSAQNTFYSDASCTSAIANVTLPSGTQNATVYFRDTKSGGPTLTAAATGLTSATQLETISAAAPTVLAFTSAPQTLTAGQCSAAANLQAQDAFGNASNVAAGATLNLSSNSGSLQFFTTSACSAAVTTATIAAGSSASTIYFRDNASGARTLTVTSGGFSSATQNATINPGAPNALVFSTANQTLVAGSCSAAATVVLKDNFGNVSPAASASAVGLSSTSTGGTFFSDPACGSSVASVTIPAGQSSATFYFRDTRAGTPTLTAASAGLSSANQSAQINAAPASRFVFTSSSQSLQAGNCSTAATLQTQDSFGNPSNASTAATIALSTTSPAGAFYSDSSCTTLASSVGLAAGSSSAQFFFKDTRAGAPTLTASASGYTAATQGETISAAAPNKLAITTLAQSVMAGTCSSAVTVQVQDAFGNASTVGAATPVSLASGSGTLTFSASAGCGSSTTSVNVASGQSSVSFFFQDTVTGSPTITVSSGALTPTSQVETVNPAPAQRLVFTTAAQSVTVGNCSGAVTFQSQDALGNASPVTSATPVNLATNSGSMTFFQDAACGTAVTSLTLASGSSSGTFYFKDTASGSVNVSANSSGFSSAAQTETLTPAAPTRFVFTSSAQTLTAGNCSAAFTARTQDGFGNFAPVTSATTVTLTTGSPGGAFFTDATCSTAAGSPVMSAGSSTLTFYYRDTKAGSSQVTVSGGGLTQANQFQTINPAAASKLVFTTPARSVTAGSCSAVLTVQTQDSFNNPANVSSATSLTLSSTSTGESFASDAACGTTIATATVPSGSNTASFYVRDTAAGSWTITVGGSLGSVTQSFTVSAAAPSALVISSAPKSQVTGACSTGVVVVVKDAYGNPANVTAATALNLASTSTGNTFFSDSACGTSATSVTVAVGANTQTFFFKDTLVGSPTLTVSASGLGSASQAQTISASTPSTMAITSSPQTLTAGNCSAQLTVVSRDGFGNPSNVTSNTTVNLSSSSTGGSFFSNAACSTAASSVTIAAGSGSATFYYRDTKAGSPTVTATATGLGSTTQGETINAAAASKLAFSTSSFSITAGNCSPVANLQTQDSFGNPSNVTSATTVNLTSSSTAGTFYSDSACSTVVTSRSVAAGSNSGSLYYKDTIAGSPTLTLSAAGLTSGTQGETISAGNPSKLVYLTSAATVVAGGCSPVATVQRQDPFGNAASSGGSYTLTLASSSTGNTFYSDSSCTTAITTATISPGGTNASFYWKDTKSGAPLHTISKSGVTSATQTETVNPANPSRIVFTTAAQSRSAGACSGAITVQSQDGFSNPSNVASATAVALSTTSSGGGFYSDSTCLNAISNPSIASGQNQTTFFYKDSNAGSPTLTATTGTLGNATQAITITPATATVLVVTTSAQSLTAGNCSAATSFQTRDSFGNASNVSGSTTVTLASSSTGATFYSNSTCTSAIAGVTLAAGSNSGTFYWKDSKAGSPTLTLSATSFTSGAQVETVNPAAPNKLMFANAPQTITAGGCSGALNVQAQDPFGNPSNVASATTVALQTPSPAGSFYSDSSCTTAITQTALASGANTTIVYYGDTRAGAFTLNAVAGGLVTASQTLTVNPAAAASLTFLTPQRAQAAGDCSQPITVQAKDAYGNAAPVSSSQLVTLQSSSAASGFYADASCSSPVAAVTLVVNTAQVTFYYQDTRAGAPTLTAQNSGLGNVAQPASISPAAAAKVVFTTPSQSLPAGNCSALVSFAIQDSFGNNAPVSSDTAVSLSGSRTSAAFFTDNSCGSALSNLTVPTGSATGTFFFKDSASGALTLTLGVSGLQSGTQVENVSAAAASRLVFANAPVTQNAGACSPVLSVQTRDANNNVSAVSSALQLSLSSSSLTGGFFSDSSCTASVNTRTINAGQSQTTFFYKDTAIGSPTLTVTASGFSPATQTLTVNPAGSASRLVFLTPPRSSAVGACSAISTVQTQDSFGNPVNAAATIAISLSSTSTQGAFFSDSACSIQVSALSIAAGGNSASFYYRDTRAGSATLTAAATGLTNASQTATLNAGAPSQLAFANAPQSFTAGGCAGPLLLMSQDAYGNASPVSALTSISLSTSSSVGQFFTDSACGVPTTGAAIAANGSATQVYYRDTAAGSPTLTANASLGTATQVETVNAGAPKKLTVLSAAQVVPAGSCSGGVTVQLQDDYGNAAVSTTDTSIGLQSSSTTMSFFADSSCGSQSSTANVIAGTSSVDLYFQDNASGSPTLTFTASGLQTATQSETINAGVAYQLAFTTAPQTLNVGSCSGAISVEMRDDLNNAATLSQSLTVVLSSDSTGGSFYSDAACTNAIQISAIPAGQSVTTVYYRDVKAGAFTLSASNPGLVSDTQAVTENAGAPTKLAFLTAAQAMTAGNCSGVATVEAQDSFGNASDLGALTTAALSSSSASTQFFSDSSCTAAISSVDLPAAASQGSFYFRDSVAGTATLTVSASALTSATQQATFTTGAAVRLGFGNQPRTVVAGSCSQAIVVQPQDAAGNAVSLGSAASITLTADSQSAGFFSNASCGAPISQITLPSGSTSVTVYVKDTKAGALNVTASTTGLANGTQAETVTGGAATGWAFVTAAQTLVAGNCSQPVTVRMSDAFGNPSPAASAIAVALKSSSTTLQLFSDATCQTALSGASIGTGAAELTFFFRDARVGQPVLTAQTAGMPDLSQQETIQAGPATALFFTGAPQNLGAGTCSRVIAVSVGDSQQNPVAVTADTTVSLASTSTTMAFFSDSACATALSSLTIAAQQSSVEFYVLDTAVGTATVTASSSGYSDAGFNVNVLQGGAASAIAFSTVPVTVEAGSCSPALRFEVDDANGVATAVTAPRSFQLSSGAQTVSFFSDATCTTKVTTLQLQAGDYRGTIFVTDSVVEKPKLTVASSGLSSATQEETIVCPMAVDGARCDDGDFCNGRETCQSGACKPNPADSCDDNDSCTADSCSATTGCVHQVTAGCCQAPRQLASYNTSAAVGVPYRVSEAGVAVLERGTGPITWSACDAPPAGFHIDPVSAVVTWVPQAAGPVNLCLRATGACGAEEQRFTVDVLAVAPTKPVASLQLSGTTVSAGASVTADGSASTPTNLYAYEWTFGDGTPPAYGATKAHTYQQSGTYGVHLRVYDFTGQFSDATDVVSVTAASCATLPALTIKVAEAANAELTPEGLVASAEVTLSLSAEGGATSDLYAWDFGDGEASSGQSATHTFKPGRYTATARVETAAGCHATASLPIEVRDGARVPPRCAVWADPTFGPAPLGTVFMARFSDDDGDVKSAAWSFSDGVSADALRNNGLAARTVDRVGTLEAILTVTDDTQLSCRATVSVTAANLEGVVAPEIVSTPTLTAQCGVAYVYGADGHVRTTGTRPVHFSAGRGDKGKPKGFSVDDDGLVSWTPEKKAGPERVTLVAENDAGAAQQDFLVQVDCPEASARPCGCSSVDGAVPLLALAALGLWLRRRRAFPG